MDKKTELSDRHSINKASPDLPQDLPAEHTNSPRSTNAHAFAALPSLRKNLLYTVLTSALAINYISNSSLFTTIETIAASIHLSEGGNAIWMISAYAMAFAACIPLAGRLSDVFRPQWCFLSGLAGICALTLGNSFVRDAKLFIALRALQGICAALTMPSSYTMIVYLYPDRKQQTDRLAAASIVTAIGCMAGFFIGALFLMAGWRWIFRFLACITLACAVTGWLLFPSTSNRALSPTAGSFRHGKRLEFLRRLDFVGVVLIMACLLLFNLALTSATVYGWSNPRFYAPFLLSLLLFPTFCLWEAKQREEYAMIPVAIMKQSSFLVVCFTGIAAEMWFTMTQLGPSRYFQNVLHDSSLIIAGKLSTQIVASIIAGLLHTFYIAKHVSAKHRLLFGIVFSCAPGLTLLIVSNGGKGLDYWRFICPGYFFGAAAMMIVFQVISVLVIQCAPSELSGIASSVFTMCCQTGIVIGSSVQAGLYTASGGISNWRGSQYGFYFLIAWLAVAFLLVAWLVPKIDAQKDEDGMEIE